MASLRVSTSMAVAWEPTARRVLQQRGVPVEPMALVLARRTSMRLTWLGMRALVAAAHVLRGRPLHEPPPREQKALAAVGAGDGPTAR